MLISLTTLLDSLRSIFRSRAALELENLEVLSRDSCHSSKHRTGGSARTRVLGKAAIQCAVACSGFRSHHARSTRRLSRPVTQA